MEKRLFEFNWLRVLPVIAALILCSFSVNAQTITGKVTDENGEVLVGVNILEKGTSNGSITDMSGSFSITVKSAQSVLIFSTLGFETQEVTVGNQTSIEVKLASKEEIKDEVVVVGYGTTKKKLTTGANLNVKGEDISSLNTTSAMDALKGITPGVSILANNGQPGAGTKVNIRGLGTTGDSNPLYVVDGVYQGNIDYLNPNDIESLDVLKDAASAAIYGSRGANGVILVTTKQGKKNMKPTITYDGYIGWQNVYKEPDLLNAKEYASIMNESLINSGLAPYDFGTARDGSGNLLVPDWNKIQSGAWNGTNWFKEMEVKDAPIQGHSVNISGGSEKSVYSLGASTFDQTGIIGNHADNYYKRFNIRMNSEHVLYSKPTMDIVTVGENLTYTKTRNNQVRQGNIYWNDVHNAMVASPFLPLYDDAGNYHKIIPWNESDPNPVGLMDYITKYNKNDNNNVTGNAYLVIQPIKNLKIRSEFGINAWWNSSHNYVPSYNLGPKNLVDKDKVTQSMGTGSSWIWTNTVTYNFKVAEDHNFVAMVGNSMERSVQNANLSASDQKSRFGDLEHAYLNNTPLDSVTNLNLSGKDDYGWGMLSYFGRVQYDYKETYMISALVRADGSANFMKGHRWGTFPSVSAGWVLSNESFMSSTTDYVNFLKLRASWGQVGNQSIGNFGYTSNIGYNYVNNNITYADASYFFGDSKGTRYTGSYPANIPNYDITWETSEQLNLGLDAHFLKSRLQATFDWYKKDTKNWLVWSDVPTSNGLKGMNINGGTVSNKGFELALNWNDKIGDLKYGASVSLTHNKNEVTAIANTEKVIHGQTNVLSQGTGEISRAQVGYPIGYFWGFVTDGVIQNAAEAAAWVRPAGSVGAGTPYYANQKPGDLRWKDLNNDGVIDDKDKTQIGDPNPHYILGLQLNLDYKGIYLNATAYGNYGQQIAKSYRSFADSYKNNYTTDVFARWHGEGTSNKYPIIESSPNRNFQNLSDLYIQNGDFLRISNITIGYDFKKLIKNLPLGEAKLYFTGKNLYTFTKYDGLDPEVGYGADGWSKGVDLGLYPQSRSYLIGLSIKF